MSEANYNKYMNPNIDESIPYERNIGQTIPIEEELKKEAEKSSDKSWLVAGVTAGFCYGFGNL